MIVVDRRFRVEEQNRIARTLFIVLLVCHSLERSIRVDIMTSTEVPTTVVTGQLLLLPTSQTADEKLTRNQEPAVCSDGQSPSTSSPRACTVSRLCSSSLARWIYRANVQYAVTPLALSRAAVDPAYTKLDLMDRTAVDGFFENHQVESES